MKTRAGMTLGMVSALAWAVSSFAAGQAFKWSFDQDTVGQAPAGFRVVAGSWTVAADKSAPSAPNVLKQTARLRGRQFGVCVKTGRKFRDFDATVKFKPISGRIDASGGIIFRFVNPRSYYVVRANALEDNFRLYYYIRGRRIQIAGCTVTPPAKSQWHTIKVSCRGDEIKCYLNGKLLITHRDGTYKKGLVGLWTKADAVTAFDDFEVERK